MDSKEDQSEKIVITIYVSNFPSRLSIRELWNICGRVGVVVDVFIGKKKNKLGQTFALVRIINIKNQKILSESLCNIQIGNLHMHANMAR